MARVYGAELARREGVAGQVELRGGQAQALPLPRPQLRRGPGRHHVGAPAHAEQAIPELVRVTRPGGRIGVFDLDGDGVVLFTPLVRDPTGFAAKMAARRAAAALQVGAITPDEQRHWLAALDAERAAGRFLGGQTHLFFWGTRPRDRQVRPSSAARSSH